MQRRLPDLSTTQLIASGVATLAAAVGASYLGVYGTILGAAFMSVASTAGSAICKHYLDQGREQLKDLSHIQAAVQQRDAAQTAAAEAVSADPTRTVAWPGGGAWPAGGDPNATRLDLPLPGAGRPGPVPPGGGDPNATRLDRTPAETVAESLAEDAGEDAVREVVRRSALQSTVEWAKRNWVKLAVSSAAVFAIVICGITLYEATTGSSLGKNEKGLTVTKVLTGGTDTQDTPSKSPSPETTEPSDAPTGGTSGTPSDTPSTGTTGGTTGRPTQTPTVTPTAPSTAPSTPTEPNTPAPTRSSGGDGGGGGGGVQQGTDPQSRTGSSAG
ncbi:hypothetical protein [Actinomadura fibrosa]|uniref:Uncharacterized protein n=1 Tax=Actinomadura fibrosa TaxID=111802 RepID=A0ABW2XR39_9ACTN|nr:hypothetical protein [Actinomadura fibrosa]